MKHTMPAVCGDPSSQTIPGDDQAFDLDSVVMRDFTPPQVDEEEASQVSLRDAFRESPLGAARSWVKAGWNVIPIHPKSKAPLIKFKQFLGPSSARVTDRMLAHWFLWSPGLGGVPNYAVLLDSGPFPLVVLDLDHADVFPWGDLTFPASKFPGTRFSVSSGRPDSGKHLYFRGQPGTVQKQILGRMGPDLHVAWDWSVDHASKSLVLVPKWGSTKVDVKSAGNYAIGPGSIHRSGKRYIASDEVSLETLEALPVWDPTLAGRLVSEHSALREERRRVGQEAIEKAYPRPEGISREQHDHVQRLICLSGCTVKPGKQDPLNLKVLDACPLTVWARINPAGLTYGIRQVLASNIAKLAGASGKEPFLAILSKHPAYDAAEAEAIWRKALEFVNHSPMTYRYAYEHGGWPGPVPERPGSPAALIHGIVDADPEMIVRAAKMTRYTFIASQNKIYDTEMREFYSTEAFAQLGPEFRLWLGKSFDSLRQQAKTLTFCTDGSNHPEAFNTFDRSLMPSKQGDQSATPDGLWDLVKNLANDDTAQAEYILDWLAFRIQFPHRPQVALVLSGEEGTGKGLFCEAAMACVGPYASTANQVALESDWNEHLHGSILVVANEISADTMKDRRRVANALKEQVLAGQKLTINPKGGKKFEIKSSAGWIICTNHDLAVSLGSSDRRYSIIRGDTPLLSLPDGRARAERFAANLRDPAWRQHLVDFLYSIDVSGFDYRTPLKTEARDRALEASQSPILAWWARTQSSDGDIPPGVYPTSFLWKRFLAWAQQVGERDEYSLIGFSRKIPPKLGRPRVARSKLAPHLLGHEADKSAQVRCVVIEDYGQTSEVVPGWEDRLDGILEL